MSTEGKQLKLVDATVVDVNERTGKSRVKTKMGPGIVTKLGTMA